MKIGKLKVCRICGENFICKDCNYNNQNCTCARCIIKNRIKFEGKDYIMANIEDACSELCDLAVRKKNFKQLIKYFNYIPREKVILT